ncbi:isochorismatase family protein [Streptomyces sp. PSKA01]|uniref:Isochorismatase family protein n=1 Tax=Streptomyces cupreus TaxID=2759956 RepID=A0A7X1J8K3_9ACTN|nr:isochorismatase family protein [Streptomyces cupreus]
MEGTSSVGPARAAPPVSPQWPSTRPFPGTGGCGRARCARRRCPANRLRASVTSFQPQTSGRSSGEGCRCVSARRGKEDPGALVRSFAQDRRPGVGVLLTAADAFTNAIQPFVVADAVADCSAEEHSMALQWAAHSGMVCTTDRLLRDLLLNRQASDDVMASDG